MRRFTAAVVVALLLLAGIFYSSSARAEFIWVEGEKPAKAAMARHPWWYDKVKTDQLSGGNFISNWSKDRIGEAEYSFNSPVEGMFDFWVRANPIQAKLSYQLNGGAWTEINLSKDQTGNINIAEDGKPDLRFIAWAHVGDAKLKRGANTIRFRMNSENNNHGYLDCFVFTNEPFAPQGVLRPNQIADSTRRAAVEDREFITFNPPIDSFKESPIDLRHLNEKKAGDGGFIAARGPAFVHSSTGEAVRFWAVNGPPSDLTGDDLKRCARMLAKHGVNLVRIHGGYYDKSGKLQMEKVKHALEIVEAMKGEGIYCEFSIYFPLWLTPDPGTPWLEGYDGKSHPFAALYFNPKFQEQYRQWWKALLSTPNDKGQRLIDEPAVFGAEIINEDSYFFWTFAEKNIPDVQLRILEKQFGDWAAKKYGSAGAALKKWNQGLKRDNPAEGRLAFRPIWNMFNEKSGRDKDTAAFLLESQRAFYADTYQFLRGLGFKGLITASNWTTASPQVFGPLEKYSYTPTDFIDRHGYFGGRHEGEGSAFSIRERHVYTDRSALRFDGEEPGKPKLFVHPVMDPTYADKPSMISETTFTRPNRYRTEAPLYYAAYGALQGSDAIVHFALDSANWAVKPRFWMQPWTLMTPSQMGQFPAVALLYRKGLVSAGDTLVELNLNITDLVNLRGTPMPQDAAFDELRLKDVPKGTQIAPGNVIDPLVHYAGVTRVNFTDKQASSKLEDLSRFIDRKAQTVVSTNSQLKLDYGKGLLVINAPAAQGLSGNLRQAKGTALKDLSITSDMELGHIIAVTLDDKPLAQSDKILLQVMSEERATGFRTEPADRGARRIVSLGTDPWQIRKMSGTVKFSRSDSGQLKVTALDGNGYAVESAGNAAEIKLRPDTVYYLVSR